MTTPRLIRFRIETDTDETRRQLAMLERDIQDVSKDQELEIRVDVEQSRRRIDRLRDNISGVGNSIREATSSVPLLGNAIGALASPVGIIAGAVTALTSQLLAARNAYREIRDLAGGGFLTDVEAREAQIVGRRLGIEEGRLENLGIITERQGDVIYNEGDREIFTRLGITDDQINTVRGLDFAALVLQGLDQIQDPAQRAAYAGEVGVDPGLLGRGLGTALQNRERVSQSEVDSITRQADFTNRIGADFARTRELAFTDTYALDPLDNLIGQGIDAVRGLVVNVRIGERDFADAVTDVQYDNSQRGD